MNNIQEVLNQLTGFDPQKQILTLWYELIFLRNCMNEVIHKSPELVHQFYQDQEGIISRSREGAKQEIQKKFPMHQMTFTDEQAPLAQKDEENP